MVLGGTHHSRRSYVAGTEPAERYEVETSTQGAAVERLWTFEELAEYLHCSKTTLHRLKDQGRMDTIQIEGTRKRLVPDSEVSKLVAMGAMERIPAHEPCIASTKDGRPCKNRQAAGSELCGSHLRGSF